MAPPSLIPSPWGLAPAPDVKTTVERPVEHSYTRAVAHRHGWLRRLEDIEDRYAPGDDRPLASFVGLLGGYAAVAGTLGALVARRRLPAPKAGDLLLYGVATATIARTVAKDPITSPLRAPFTEFTGETTGPAELKEEVQGSGTRKAVGELLTCPFCVAPWVATLIVAGHALLPAATRFAAGIAGVTTVSDFLQYATAAAQKVE